MVELDNQTIWLNEYGRVDVDVYVPISELKSDLVVGFLIPWSDTIHRETENILGDVVYNKGDHKMVNYYLVANYLYEKARGKEHVLDWSSFLMSILFVNRLTWEMESWMKEVIVCNNCKKKVSIVRSSKLLSNLLLCPECNRNMMKLEDTKTPLHSYDYA